jgi:hypothetical protein
MNCRKARSLVSAFSKGELSHSLRDKIAEHLDCCPACQKHKAAVVQINQAIDHLPRHELSDDFNMKLFERIHNGGREVNTSSALLPKKAPVGLVYWSRVLSPVAALLGVVALTFVFMFPGGNADSNPGLAQTPMAVSGAQQAYPAQPATQYGLGLNGMALHSGLADSITSTVRALDDRYFEWLSQEKKRGFGYLDSGRSLFHNAGQRGGQRHYVLPTVSPTSKLIKEATF